MDDGASILINLAMRYATAFGVAFQSKAVVVKEDNKYKVEYYDKQSETQEEVIFKFDGNKMVFGAMLLDDTGIFAPPLMMNFSKEKRLIETEVSGSDNMVVERWGTSNWIINITGILIDVENRAYPQEKIEELVKLFDYNNIVKVSGNQFLDKDIDSVYFQAVHIEPLEGFADTVRFNLSARSIKEVSYSLSNPNE
ncbi:hypothetical protein BWK59_08170 [Flavobacterium davisii]|uniref:DUF6046 domain-containing protein n=2 Tax=Flavobacterium TaxID=237 RepID=A0A246GIF5_9FLAO|nr:DUF6046 domain-containing protein [Flavobacterium davisii]OWP83882.1 hypothetical protein BWK59_08170 [Flavobacterium davisii]QYS89163.1 hypothetical protein JJC05_01685 [Flavobacterium davisii]